MNKLILKSGKDASIRRYHPWVFSGAIKKIKNESGKEVVPEEGEILKVVSNHDEFLGMGHYQNGSIAVRIVSFEEREIGDEFWVDKIKNAVEYRKTIDLIDNNDTNVYRLIHAEGDGLPGLIVDVYGNTAVIQAHSFGMHLNRNTIAKAIVDSLEGRITSVYYKSKETLPKALLDDVENGFLIEGESSSEVVENGCKFNIDWVGGQKTGFFVDQRENRALLAKYSKGKKVLNTFCYSGGFSVYALKAGAIHVDSVDASAKAIDLTDENVKLNSFTNHNSFAVDTFKFLEENNCEEYDIVVLDPPAFAKHQNVKHNAVQGYKRLNATTIKKMKKGALLFTFSCSQVVDQKLFYSTLMAAAIQAKRKVRVVHQLSQPADHPINIFHQESSYLKGLVLEIE